MAVSFVALFVALTGSALALQANSVGKRELKGDAVRSGHIKDGQVKARDIRDVPWGKLTSVPAGFADGIDNTGGGGGPASNIVCSGCVGASDLGAASVIGSKLAGNSVTGAKVADGSLTGSDVVNGSMALADLGTNSVNTSKIVDRGVLTSDLADRAVTSPKLADNAADSRVIANGGVRTTDLVDNTVTSAKLANGAVRATKLGPIIERFDTTPINPFALARAVATCPTGTVLISGGFTLDDQEQLFLIHSRRSGSSNNSWEVTARNRGSQSSEVVASAYCLAA